MSPTDKNNLFAFYLATVSKPFPSKSTSHETKIFTYFQSPCQTSSIKLFFLQEIKAMIDKNLNRKEVSGHDLVSDEVIKELPKRGLPVTCIFNTILRIGYYPFLRKLSIIPRIHRPGKSVLQGNGIILIN